MHHQSPPTESKYKPIWNKLKAEKICKITAPPKYHKIIIKMVRRTRDRDLQYLYLLSEANKTHEIKAYINGTVIEFHLKERINWNGL